MFSLIFHTKVRGILFLESIWCVFQHYMGSQVKTLHLEGLSILHGVTSQKPTNCWPSPLMFIMWSYCYTDVLFYLWYLKFMQEYDIQKMSVLLKSSFWILLKTKWEVNFDFALFLHFPTPFQEAPNSLPSCWDILHGKNIATLKCFSCHIHGR